jgi:hypothetical protein
MDNLHDTIVARSVWLSRIQGFYAWGIGHYDEGTQDWDKFDGLSGNQVLLFHALDAFLGIEQYLSPRDQERNVPKRQREFCHALRRHSFRAILIETPHDADVVEILRNFDEILKRLRVSVKFHRGCFCGMLMRGLVVQGCTPHACEDISLPACAGETAYDRWKVAVEGRYRAESAFSGRFHGPTVSSDGVETVYLYTLLLLNIQLLAIVHRFSFP